MSDSAIRMENLGKMYKLYSRPGDKVLDALGINRFLFWRKNYYHEFWALRDINMEIKKGDRIGIIGRNGAGKSTLLKLISGNIFPTEGKLEVNGKIQALLELGTGFHPEFTGRENIRASLAYQGLPTSQINRKEEEIIDFAELEGFIDQPIKTYSTGMNARLAFSTATAIEPEILIIDEVLGAGDAYFAGKCVERMKKLTEESGATVIFVSHDLSSVQRLCSRVDWLERGKIVMRGQSLEVVKAYEKFIRDMEDRRLKAKNLKQRLSKYDQTQIDAYTESLVLSFQLQGDSDASCDIAEIALFKDDQEEETLEVGGVQDSNYNQAAALILEGSQWSQPKRINEGFCRSLTVKSIEPNFAIGYAVFYAFALFENARYEFHIKYRCIDTARLFLTISRNGTVVRGPVGLPTGKLDWMYHRISLYDQRIEPQLAPNGVSGGDLQSMKTIGTENDDARSVTRWPGEGSLMIESVSLLGSDNQEKAVFRAGEAMILELTMVAKLSRLYVVIPVAVLYRIDGIRISSHIGMAYSFNMIAGEKHIFRLFFPSLNLGNGSYVFSTALYKKLISMSEAEVYDLLDRSYEFKIIGNDPLNDGVFQHPCEWMCN